MNDVELVISKLRILLFFQGDGFEFGGSIFFNGNLGSVPLTLQIFNLLISISQMPHISAILQKLLLTSHANRMIFAGVLIYAKLF